MARTDSRHRIDSSKKRKRRRTEAEIATARQRVRERLAELTKRRELAKERLPGLRYALDVAAQARAVELGLPEGEQIRASEGGPICNAIAMEYAQARADARLMVASEERELTLMLLRENWSGAEIARALRSDPDATAEFLQNTAEKKRVMRAKQDLRREKGELIAGLDRLIAGLDAKEVTDDFLGATFFAGMVGADDSARALLEAVRRQLIGK